MFKNTAVKAYFQRLTALMLAGSLIFSMAACKPKENPEEIQESFDAFTDEIFISDITENIINLHWTLAFPEDYGIEDYKISFGDFSEEYEEESFEELRDMLKRLEEFDRELLTEEQQLTYDIMRTYGEDTLKTEGFRL